MKWILHGLLVLAGLAALPTWAQDINGCPAGSYSVVLSPDGTSLSILFDQFTLESSAAANGGKQMKMCRIAAPLLLPANRSIGVYKVDYRGFAKLAAKQVTELNVQYFLGPHDNDHGRVFKRQIRGPQESDYTFTETIGAGQMKRVGCGKAAILNVNLSLTLEGNLQAGDAMSSLDTADGAPGGALVYHFDLKPCN